MKLFELGILALIGSLGLVGCSIFKRSESQVVTLWGHYREGFEVQAFQACGQMREWDAKFDEATFKKSHSLVNVSDKAWEYPITFVKIRAEKSLPGVYGHLGSYPIELNKFEILERKESKGREQDCLEIKND